MHWWRWDMQFVWKRVPASLWYLDHVSNLLSNQLTSKWLHTDVISTTFLEWNHTIHDVCGHVQHTVMMPYMDISQHMWSPMWYVGSSNCHQPTSAETFNYGCQVVIKEAVDYETSKSNNLPTTHLAETYGSHNTQHLTSTHRKHI